MLYLFGVSNTRCQNIKIAPPYGYLSIKYPYTINFVPRKFYTRPQIVKSADFTTNPDNVLGAGTSQEKIGVQIFQNLKNSLISIQIKRMEYHFKQYKNDNKNLFKKGVLKKNY